jgi:hypothetical protein
MGGRRWYVGNLGVLQGCPHINAAPLLIHQGESNLIINGLFLS